jgi:hypothetical protein
MRGGKGDMSARGEQRDGNDEVDRCIVQLDKLMSIAEEQFGPGSELSELLRVIKGGADGALRYLHYPRSAGEGSGPQIQEGPMDGVDLWGFSGEDFVLHFYGAGSFATVKITLDVARRLWMMLDWISNNTRHSIRPVAMPSPPHVTVAPLGLAVIHQGTGEIMYWFSHGSEVKKRFVTRDLSGRERVFEINISAEKGIESCAPVVDDEPGPGGE